MPALLKALSGGNAYALEDFTLIGRSGDSDIQIEDAGVSRQHATIRREGAYFWLVDLGSANGSYVNDVAITSARALRDGDRLQFGTQSFLFEHNGHEDGTQDPAVNFGMKTQVLSRPATTVKTQTATLLVGDLKGFTNLSRQLQPEQVAELLREWYADCNLIMQKTGAIIDKFIGDCVFAYWPGNSSDIRSKAYEAARALREVEMNAGTPIRKLLKEEKGLLLDCRVGLHVGDIAVGAMGKNVNTALGDAVNLTFRVESLTRQVGRPILASSDFVCDWKEGRLYFESCGSFDVKGYSQQIEVFAPRF